MIWMVVLFACRTIRDQPLELPLQRGRCFFVRARTRQCDLHRCAAADHPPLQGIPKPRPEGGVTKQPLATRRDKGFPSALKNMNQTFAPLELAVIETHGKISHPHRDRFHLFYEIPGFENNTTCIHKMLPNYNICETSEMAEKNSGPKYEAKIRSFKNDHGWRLGHRTNDAPGRHRQFDYGRQFQSDLEQSVLEP
jgi:hypothetical protein